MRLSCREEFLKDNRLLFSYFYLRILLTLPFLFSFTRLYLQYLLLLTIVNLILIFPLNFNLLDHFFIHFQDLDHFHFLLNQLNYHLKNFFSFNLKNLLFNLNFHLHFHSNLSHLKDLFFFILQILC